jgi:hypothetical protein
MVCPGARGTSMVGVFRFLDAVMITSRNRGIPEGWSGGTEVMRGMKRVRNGEDIEVRRMIRV